MPFFTKNPVTIEAHKLSNPLVRDAIAEWCKADAVDDGLIIHTLEGDHLARYGDWIIKGVKGEFYPCKPDIFEQTYSEEDIPEEFNSAEHLGERP